VRGATKEAGNMAEPEKRRTITLQLMVSTLAMTNALSKLLIEKGLVLTTSSSTN
jgi:hypothetical protein